MNASLPVLLDDGTRKYVWGLGLAFAVDASGSPIVYHTDGLGSVRVVTDVSGNVIQIYQTDEFGVPAASVGSITQPFGYTGEPRDAETGLSQLRARMYDPAIGRFLSKDPAAGSTRNPTTLNPYSYVGNNPANRVDPSGRLWFSAGAAVGAVAGGGLYADETRAVVGGTGVPPATGQEGARPGPGPMLVSNPPQAIMPAKAGIQPRRHPAPVLLHADVVWMPGQARHDGYGGCLPYARPGRVRHGGR